MRARAVVVLAGVFLAGCGDAPSPVRVQAPPEPPAAAPVRAAEHPAFAPDGRLLAVKACTAIVLVEGEDRVRRLHRLEGCPETAVLSPDTKAVAQVVAGKRHNRLEVRRVKDGKRRFSTRVSTSELDSPRLLWSPDGRYVLTEIEGSTGSTVFDARTGKAVRKLRTGSTYLGRQPFSPDGRRVVVSDARGVRLVTVATGRERRVSARARIDRPSWSPTGTAIAGTTASVVTLDLETRELRAMSSTGVSEVAWSPDGRRLATYGQDGGGFIVTVIDPETGGATPVHRFDEGYEQGQLSWSPDGTKIAFVTAPPV